MLGASYYSHKSRAVTVRHVRAKEKSLRRGSKQFDRIAVFGRHQRGKHLNLQRRYFRKKADAVGDAAFVCFQNVQHIAHQIQGTFFNALAAEDNFLRVDPIRDGKRRLLVI
jgi:hypothetical protein